MKPALMIPTNFRHSRRATIALFACAAIVATGFSRNGNASAAPQASTIVTLAKLREAWVQNLHDKQLEPILKFYAPDAVFLEPNGDRITGSAALRTLFQTVMAAYTSDLTLHSQNLESSGDLAYDSGTFEETLTNLATHAKISSKGCYIIIYRRQQDLSWQIIQHAWTGAPPPGA